MIYNIITRYKLGKFAIYFASINTVMWFPFVIGSIYESGLLGFIGFIYFPVLIIILPFFLIFSLSDEIRFLVKDLKLYKKRDFFYHFFTLHIFSHALFLSLLIFLAGLKGVL